MTWLQKIREEGASTSGRTNIVIVPGNNGETLADQTCSHFPNWLDDIVASKNKSTVVWIFRHDIRIDSINSWFAYCEAGEHLLQNLTCMQNDDRLSDDDTLILIGHKLGSFMLKKALLEAHRRSHHLDMDALLNTVETLVMLGDPDLNPGNRNEWIPLISKCFPCKTIPKHLDCPQDARCLQHIAGCFEEFTLHSTLFQVSSAAETKRKHFLKFRAEDHRCICSANMTVRMWTTTNEESTIPPGEGDKKNCAFYPKSTLYNRLLSIPSLAAQASIPGPHAPLPLLEVQTSDVPSTSRSMEESVADLTRDGPGSPQATFLTMVPRLSTDTRPVTTVKFSDASIAEDDTNRTARGDQQAVPRKVPSDSSAAKANTGPETLPCYDVGIESLEAISSEQVRHEDSDIEVVRQDSFENPSVLQPQRVARRSPFLCMRVPSRDAKFFGREELLIPLGDILAPVSVPSNGDLGSLDSGAVIVLHGAPGVGKSAIALELTYRTQSKFDYVLWLRANSKVHLAQSFHEAAVSLGLVQDRKDHNHESSRQRLLAWLSTTSSKWLLVLDDADELQSLPHYMPNRRCGSIIVTSRQSYQAGLGIEEDECSHTFQVDPFVEKDATAFIRSLAPCAIDAADTATLTTIAESCGYLPLTLRRVGTIINRRGSIKDNLIMATLEKHASRVLASQPSSHLIYASLSSASLALANVITFLDPYCIDDAILLGAQRYKNVPLSAFPMKDDDYFNAKDELITHALLAVRVGSSAIDMHRVIARSIRANLDPNSFREGFQSACQLLEARWPSRKKMKNIVHGNWPEFDALHRHVHKISDILVKHHKVQQIVSDIYSTFESYLKILFLSTWYNARRGNAEEDQVLIRLAHGLIARSQRPDFNLEQTEAPSTKLPARLIDVGPDETQSPRLVDTVGQTGRYVAFDHCPRSLSSLETHLTVHNMSRLQQSLESSVIPRCVSDAIDLTRSLGERYLWTESLCLVQEDQEALSRMPDIYRSAVLTIVADGTKDENVHRCVDGLALEQPFSIFLDWSRPAIAKSLSDRLFTPKILGRHNFIEHWAVQKNPAPKRLLMCFTRRAQARRKIAQAAQTDQSDAPHEDIPGSDQTCGANSIHMEVETTDRKANEANREIDQGVHHVEASKNFEALASFMKARELVSAFQALTPRSWQIHAVASANIALIYQMQNLPAMALDIVESSLAVQSRLPEGECNSSSERVRLQFVMGGVYNALENFNESQNHYKLASKDLETLPEKQYSLKGGDWKAVLDLKLAQHHLRTREYKAAHALLQQSLNNFESQETLSAQAHLARTLHWQSLVYGAQGSKIMGNAIQAAARQTWMGVREARGRAVSEGLAALSTEDFDGEVELCYR